MNIKYLKHKAIDKNRWDACINTAPNGLVYGLSWYLDVVCPGWDALVADDYSAVMPLPWKQKLGIKYIYHPLFAQQLGVFGSSDYTQTPATFLKNVPKSFMRTEFSLNHQIRVASSLASVRKNFLLNLNYPYKTLTKGFNENTKRNIGKSRKSDIKLVGQVSQRAFMELKRSNPVNDLKEAEYQTMGNLIAVLIDKKLGQLIGCSDAKGNLIAAALFVKFKNRLIYMFSASANEGKNSRAMFLILDEVVKNNAGTNTLLDFEGSMIDGVARFFSGFGAQAEHYTRIKYLNLRRFRLP
jgi:hypothetical protein